MRTLSIQAFLAAASARTPLAVIDMLLARVDAAAGQSPVRYQPVPFPHPSADWWAGLESESRHDTLARIAEAALLPHTPPRAVHLPKLFAWVAGDWAEDTRAVILKWAESGIAERAGVSVEMIAGAPRALVYDQAAFVERVLAAAAASGAEPAALRAFRLAPTTRAPSRGYSRPPTRTDAFARKRPRRRRSKGPDRHSTGSTATSSSMRPNSRNGPERQRKTSAPVGTPSLRP